MIVRHARSVALGLVVAGALAATGCTKVRDQQGYYADEALIAAIQPGEVVLDLGSGSGRRALLG